MKTKLKKVETLSLADTAFKLHSELGPLRNWTSFLNDINRGDPTNIRGLQLFPCLRQHDGHTYRPRYALSDVLEFIRRVRAIEPKAGPATIKTTAFTINPNRFWKVNKFDQHGQPIAMLRRVFGYAGTHATAH